MTLSVRREECNTPGWWTRTTVYAHKLQNISMIWGHPCTNQIFAKNLLYRMIGKNVKGMLSSPWGSCCVRCRIAGGWWCSPCCDKTVAVWREGTSALPSPWGQIWPERLLSGPLAPSGVSGKTKLPLLPDDAWCGWRLPLLPPPVWEGE